MFIGESGIARVARRTCEAMRAAAIDDPHDIDRVRALGVVDLPTLQKKANFHYSVSLDLFGSEISTNAANAFSAGLKGRCRETRIDDDHRLIDATYPVLKLVDGALETVDAPALTAVNVRLRDDYTRDATRGLERLNKIIAGAGVEFRLELPHVAFHRAIGEFAGVNASPSGELLDAGTWRRRRHDWLPSDDDNAFIASLMKPCREPGRYAAWIAAPKTQIDNKPGDFEYVRLQA